jgi:hypothetical protein
MQATVKLITILLRLVHECRCPTGHTHVLAKRPLSHYLQRGYRLVAERSYIDKPIELVYENKSMTEEVYRINIKYLYSIYSNIQEHSRE